MFQNKVDYLTHLSTEQMNNPILVVPLLDEYGDEEREGIKEFMEDEEYKDGDEKSYGYYVKTSYATGGMGNRKARCSSLSLLLHCFN